MNDKNQSTRFSLKDMVCYSRSAVVRLALGLMCVVLMLMVLSYLPDFILQAGSRRVGVESALRMKSLTEESKRKTDSHSSFQPPQGETPIPGIRIAATASAVINFAELAEQVKDQPIVPKIVEAPMPIPISKLPEGAVIRNTEPSETEEHSTSLEANRMRTIATRPNAVGFQASQDDGSVPPDTHGAVGLSHLMVPTNGSVQIRDRAGQTVVVNGQTVPDVSLAAFWGALFQRTETVDVFDPKVFYDPFENRWMFTVTAQRRSANSSVLIAVSQTSDPTGIWNRYRYDVDAQNQVWADRPEIGFNRHWIVVQANIYSIPTSTNPESFNRSHIYVFDKADLYADGAGQGTLFSLTGNVSSQVPAVTYDNTQNDLHLVRNLNGNDKGNGHLQIYTISGAIGSETLATGAMASTTATWDDSGISAPQRGTATRISTGDSRIQSVIFRNGSLWIAHTVFLPTNAPTRSAVQWWEITPNGAIQQRGRIDDSSGVAFYAFPSISVNRNNDVLIGYSRFSANQFASANYSFRLGTDPANTLCPDTVLKDGEASYSEGGGRWGDYSNAVVDPINDLNLWTVQQYSAMPNGADDRWGLWWGQILLEDVADLEIIKGGGGETIVAGEDVGYLIIVTNKGPSAAANVAITDTLPANTTLSAFVAPPDWNCKFPDIGGTGTIKCTKPAMVPFERAAIGLVLKVSPFATEGSVITNKADASTTTKEPPTNNNTSSAISRVITLADLEIVAKLDAPDPVITNSPLIYSIILRNNGPSAALIVSLSDNLPVGAIFNSCQSTGGGTCAGNGQNRTVTYISLAPGQLETVTLATTANCALADGQRIRNTAMVRSLTADPFPGNESGSATTTASNPPPVIACSLDLDVVAAVPGSDNASINYPAPAVTDNCPDVTVVCSPPSSSNFPLGTTQVICVATDSGGATASCSFNVTVWDVSIQDETSGDYLLFNSFTGDYKFQHCGSDGFTMKGRGIVNREGCATTLHDDTRVKASFDRCHIAPVNTGNAVIKRRQPDTSFILKDRNILNNSPTCR